MKFRHRQILLFLGLISFVVVIFLHSRTPDSDDRMVRLNQGQILAFVTPKQLTAPRTHIPSQSVEQKNGKDRGELNNKNGGEIVHGDQVKDAKKDVAEVSLKDRAESDQKKQADVAREAVPPFVYVNQTTKSECPSLLRPENVRDTQEFQKMDGQTMLYVFSAFLDVQKNMVRIIGLSSNRIQSTFCVLWYHPHQQGDDPQKTDTEMRVVSATVTMLPEHHSRKYKADYIECGLPTTDVYPYAVSVTSEDCRGKNEFTQPSNVMPLLKTSMETSSENMKHNFTVCVTALNYRYSRAYELVEMIELNRLLGADQFTFYVNSIGDNVAKVLRWYQEKGLVQLIKWELPMIVDHWPPIKEKPEVHYFAQLASHNDCLNRHRGSSRYLVYQDLDEFIIPKKTSSWSQLLDTLNSESNTFMFRCVFFRKDWPPNSENFTGRSLADRFRSLVLATDKREPSFFPYGQRSKYMVKPEAVRVVGIHNIWNYRTASKPSQVKETDALLHHYRGWENPSDVDKAVRDTDMYRFKDRLLQKLKERWAELPEVPLDIPLSVYGQV